MKVNRGASQPTLWVQFCHKCATGSSAHLSVQQSKHCLSRGNNQTFKGSHRHGTSLFAL